MFSQQQLLETFSELSTNDKIALEWRLSFLAKAHSYQLMPNWAWTVWLLCGGRGCGKTWTASNQVGWLTWEDSKSRILVMAPTANDIRFTCFEGESGLLNVIPHQLIKKYNKSLFELELVNGGQLRGISADSYERLRGPQWSACWMDELAAYEYLQEAWDMAMFGLRLGKHPRVIATTTPKPKPLITNLLEREGKDVAVNRATSYANLDNLAPTFKAQITQYEGTKLGRQEIHAEIIDPFEAGVIKKAWIKMWGAETPLPPLQFVLYSLDTAFTEKTAPTKEERRRGTYEDRDPTACSVWGVFVNKKTHRQEIILLDCWEDYLGLPELIVRVKRELKQSFGANLIEPLIAPKIKSTHPHPTESQGRHPDLIIIEDKGSGISLRQMLAREGIRAYPYVPTTDKLERLHSVSHIFYHGCVWMPESEKIRGRFKSWTNTLVEQLCSYAGEGSIAHDDLCFVAGTLITMADGVKKSIEKVKVGDFVKTPFGDYEVEASFCSGINQVSTIKTKHHELTGTNNHPIFTNQGFIALSEVDTTMKLLDSRSQSWVSNQLARWWYKPLFSTIDAITDILKVKIQHIEDTTEEQDIYCTAMCGNFTMEKFHPTMKYTTSTMTRAITELRIYNAFQSIFTEKCFIKIWFAPMCKDNILQEFANKRKSGIEVKQVEHGIENTLKILFVRVFRILKKNQLKKNVYGAVLNILQNLKNHYFARLLTKLTHHATKEVLKKTAQPIMQATYNLTVKTVNCYYANDLLVHNCDSTTQALIYLANSNHLSMTVMPEVVLKKSKSSENVYSS